MGGAPGVRLEGGKRSLGAGEAPEDPSREPAACSGSVQRTGQAVRISTAPRELGPAGLGNGSFLLSDFPASRRFSSKITAWRQRRGQGSGPQGTA